MWVEKNGIAKHKMEELDRAGATKLRPKPSSPVEAYYANADAFRLLATLFFLM